MTSHAAVIARGLGLPCVVGAGGIRIDRRARTLTVDDGRVFTEGDVVTLDGSSGELLAGAATLMEPELDDASRDLRRKTHETIRRVTTDIEDRQQFNTAVSAMMELVNAKIVRRFFCDDQTRFICCQIAFQQLRCPYRCRHIVQFDQHIEFFILVL